MSALRHLTALCGLALLAAACSTPPPQDAARSVVLYEGARLVPGDGGAPIDDSALLVENGAITRVGRRGNVSAPDGAARVDLSGKTVMPALVGAHGHVGYQRGLGYSADNYTRENILDDLHRAAYFGVGAVASQGIDGGDVAFRIREEQSAGTLGGARLLLAGRGLGAPNAGPGAAAFNGVAYEVTAEEEARQAVRDLAAKQVDFVKVWVDDRGGRAPKMSPAVYRAVIDEAHENGLRVSAHVFYHDDAVDLVESGVDAFAHLVRDRDMDDALVAAIVRRNVYVMPNLGVPERATHDAAPGPWADPNLLRLLNDTIAPSVVERMRRAFETREPAVAARARERYAILQRSLAKLNAAGARIVLGSDTGVEDHPFGYAEQRELELMAAAGMTPAQVIVAATSRPAEFLRLEDTGTLAAGKRADFLVLDANPLDDIRHVRRIAAVYLRGREVDRASLRNAWSAGAVPVTP